MRHDNFPALLACVLGLLLSLTSARPHKRFIGAFYKQTGMSGCFAGTLPTHCTGDFQETPQCSSTFGSATRTWYKDGACTIPCYEKP